jgi:hypothetical protein
MGKVWAVPQVAECLPSKEKALGSIISTEKKNWEGIAAHYQ